MGLFLLTTENIYSKVLSPLENEFNLDTFRPFLNHRSLILGNVCEFVLYFEVVFFSI